MRGAGEPSFETDFPPGTDMMGRSFSGPAAAKRLEAELASRLGSCFLPGTLQSLYSTIMIQLECVHLEISSCDISFILEYCKELAWSKLLEYLFAMGLILYSLLKEIT
ncbi:hypothetical protein V1521DRAFT_431310 [Lipomyces starkeyi]